MAKENKAKKPVYKRWWFWVLIVLGLIIIISCIAGANNGPKKVEDGNGTSSSQTQKQDKYKVGDTFEVNGLQLKVNSVERNVTDTGMNAENGKEYVKVSVTYKNVSNSKKSYNAADWKLGDSSGALENYTVVLHSDGFLNYGDLTQDGTKTGFVWFKAPANDKITIHYNPSYPSADVTVETE